MKNTKTTTVILLLLASLLYVSCEKTLIAPKEPRGPVLDEYGLPTLEGNKGTIYACLVNGEPWVSDVFTGLLARAPSSSYYRDTRRFSVGGSIKKNRPLDISSMVSYIKLNTFEPNIYYPLRDSLEGGGACSKTSCYYSYKKQIDPDFNYLEILEMETGAWKSVKGRFQMKLVNERSDKCLDTIVITQGRFRMPYNYVQ